MLSIRIVAAGAVLVMAVGGAAAQTTTSSAPGKPISLLQTAQKSSKARPLKPHVKIAKKAPLKKHRIFAAEKSTPAPTKTAAAPANAWPALPPVAPTAAAAAEAAPQPAPATSDTQPSDIVVKGQTVQVAPPDAVNAIDLAADNHNDAALAATKGDSAQATPAVQAMVAAPAVEDASPVGSAKWIAQVLAAFGGAVAAGSVAWFLIGSTPQRMYG